MALSPQLRLRRLRTAVAHAIGCSTGPDEELVRSLNSFVFRIKHEPHRERLQAQLDHMNAEYRRALGDLDSLRFALHPSGGLNRFPISEDVGLINELLTVHKSKFGFMSPLMMGAIPSMPSDMLSELIVRCMTSMGCTGLAINVTKPDTAATIQAQWTKQYSVQWAVAEVAPQTALATATLALPTGVHRIWQQPADTAERATAVTALHVFASHYPHP